MVGRDTWIAFAASDRLNAIGLISFKIATPFKLRILIVRHERKNVKTLLTFYFFRGMMLNEVNEMNEFNEMVELNDFYDIVNTLRQRCHLSVRQLAREMKMPPTTLASIFSRRPDSLDREILIRFGLVFDLKWYTLLNKSSASEARFKGTSTIKIDLTLSDEDIQSIYENILVGYRCPARFERQNTEAPESTRSGDDDFKRGMMFVINRLNEDGLMKVMQMIIQIAADPQYCISTDSHTSSNKKEDELCQENEP